MTVPLYPHQSDMNESVRQEMARGHKSVLMCGATGIGKTRMACAKIQASQRKEKKSAFIVPKRDLVRQMAKAFSEFDISHSFVANGYPFNPFSPTHICTQASLINRLDRITPDLVIIDETHWGSTALDKIINHYKSRGAYTIGLSASPERLDGKGLGMWYSSIVEGPPVRWLIDNAYLSQYRLFAPCAPDLSGVKTIGGDYANNALSEIMQDKAIIGNAVQHYKDHAMGRSNVAFCTSVKHAEITAQAFRDAGVPAQSIDGTMDDTQRKAIIQAFAKKEILSLTSVDLLHTGFDLAMNAGMDVTVESMSDLRPTQSLALQLQKWGRVLRKKDMPALIFDHSSNIQRFGLPCDKREWSLAGRDKKKGDSGEKAIPVKQCPKCYYVSAPSPSCVNCGHIYPIESRMVKTVEGELVEMTPEQAKEMALVAAKKLRMQQGQCRTLQELIAFGIKTGKKNPVAWANIIFKSRGAARPNTELSVSMHIGDDEIQF